MHSPQPPTPQSIPISSYSTASMVSNPSPSPTPSLNPNPSPQTSVSAPSTATDEGI